MIISALYIILTALGLSFLIFIHELGHYFMGRKVGMRVEVFSIGFGKPLLVWYRDGVRWQICLVPFGGYVKFAGESSEGDLEPHEIPDGFYGKSPWDRIKVAFMGPFVNICFAFVAFTLLWVSGGRDKSFREFTSYIGWVDPISDLYTKGVRPGDKITSYDDHEFTGQKDHLYASLLSDGDVTIAGLKVDYKKHSQETFQYILSPYPHPYYLNKDVRSFGILDSASNLIYDRYNGADNPIQDSAPIASSGIEYSDRIVWVDGEQVFSQTHLSYLVNQERALLTVARGDESLLFRAPRIPLREFNLDATVRDEVEDWQFESKVKGKFFDLVFLPYDLTLDCVVQSKLQFIDEEDEAVAFPAVPFSPMEEALKPGDRIIAVDGTPVSKAYDILASLQEKRLHIAVERIPDRGKSILWTEADTEQVESVDWSGLNTIASSLGNGDPITSSGSFVLLKAITPIKRKDLPLPPEKKEWYENLLQEKKKQLEEIQDSQKRNEALQVWEDQQNQLILGLSLQDSQVTYNPQPQVLFASVFEEISRTLQALVVGDLNPKHLSGPVGIVQIIHHGFTVGLKEALYWLALISLNLAVLNLLPIPVLDGGHICMSLFEMVTKKPIKAQTMERLVLPFMVLLMVFFVYITFQDVFRLFGQYFH
ncbi:MAG: regulator of sigma E protease [Chlamydiales bacterium]|jgi:regulator of sigma E protease